MPNTPYEARFHTIFCKMNEFSLTVFSLDLKTGDGYLALPDLVEIQDLHDRRNTGKSPREWNGKARECGDNSFYQVIIVGLCGPPTVQ